MKEVDESNEDGAIAKLVLRTALFFVGVAACFVHEYFSLGVVETLKMIALGAVVAGACGFIFSAYRLNYIIESIIIILFFSWFYFWTYFKSSFDIGFWYLVVFSIIVSLLGYLSNPSLMRKNRE